MKYPLVYVEWEDHHGAQEWQNPEDVNHSPFVCESVGWLYREDSKGITVIGSQYTNGVGNAQYIIKSCITKLQVWRKPHEKKPKVVKKDAISNNEGIAERGKGDNNVA